MPQWTRGHLISRWKTQVNAIRSISESRLRKSYQCAKSQRFLSRPSHISWICSTPQKCHVPWSRFTVLSEKYHLQFLLFRRAKSQQRMNGARLEMYGLRLTFGGLWGGESQRSSFACGSPEIGIIYVIRSMIGLEKRKINSIKILPHWKLLGHLKFIWEKTNQSAWWRPPVGRSFIQIKRIIIMGPPWWNVRFTKFIRLVSWCPSLVSRAIADDDCGGSGGIDGPV